MTAAKVWTIKDHIEAGHYPKDEKGRALVPARNSAYGAIVIAATDVPGPRPLVGWPAAAGRSLGSCTFTEYGVNCEGCGDMHLLPPAPRKVKVKKYTLCSRWLVSCLLYETREEAERAAAMNATMVQVVELTGEYEEPWA